MRAAFASIAMLITGLLSGCAETLFESTPGNKIVSCDQHFVGAWRLGTSDKSDGMNADKLFVIVDPACKAFHFIENGKGDPESESKTHIAFAKVGQESILTLKIDIDRNSDEKERKWRDGYRYFLYEIRDKEIQLHPVDDKQVAHMIIDDKILGRTENISRSPGGGRPSHGDMLSNFVVGKPDDLARVAQMSGIFTKPYLTLKPATQDEISKSEKAPPSNP
jgi:hypothetical protein